MIDSQGVEEMNKQRKVVITITYNEMGIIVDTKAEELGSSAQPDLDQWCTDCKDYWRKPKGRKDRFEAEEGAAQE